MGFHQTKSDLLGIFGWQVLLHPAAFVQNFTSGGRIGLIFHEIPWNKRVHGADIYATGNMIGVY